MVNQSVYPLKWTISNDPIISYIISNITSSICIPHSSQYECPSFSNRAKSILIHI